MIYGYIRVSTEEQTVENQRMVIKKYCRHNHYNGIEWIAETISGCKAPKKRLLGQLLNKVVENDIIICTELSRLGRSMIMIMTVLEQLKKQKVRVITIKENYDNSSDDIYCTMISGLFAMFAQIERTLISQRTKEGLARKRTEGVVLGRQKGELPTKWKLTPYNDKIKSLISHHHSINSIARKYNVEWETVKTYIERHLK